MAKNLVVVDDEITRKIDRISEAFPSQTFRGCLVQKIGNEDGDPVEIMMTPDVAIALAQLLSKTARKVQKHADATHLNVICLEADDNNEKSHGSLLITVG